MKPHYVTALKRLLTQAKTSDVASILKNFQKVLHYRGHGKLYGAVLRSVARELSTVDATTSVVTVATPAAAKSKQVQAAAAVLGSAKPHIVIDDSVIGGFKIKVADKEIDHTYKSALLHIYRNLTT